MSAPDGMPGQVKDMMLKCWSEVPERRVKFAKIVSVLDKVCDGFDISLSGLDQFK